MFKKMFLDNWFSTIAGVVGAAYDAIQTGVHWRQAIIIGIGVVLKDGVPGIKTKGEGQ